MSEIKVSILMGSDSDLNVMKKASDTLKEFNVGHEMRILSAHRVPEELKKYILQAEKKGTKVFIAGAGLAAHLPGVVASLTKLPVIGVPLASGSLNGLDSLLAIVQMPSGVPVATVAIDGAKNAAILAVQILSVADKTLATKMSNHKKKMKAEVLKKNKKLVQSS